MPDNGFINRLVIPSAGDGTRKINIHNAQILSSAECDDKNNPI
jgi:hypothetical protein